MHGSNSRVFAKRRIVVADNTDNLAVEESMVVDYCRVEQRAAGCLPCQGGVGVAWNG